MKCQIIYIVNTTVAHQIVTIFFGKLRFALSPNDQKDLERLFHVELKSTCISLFPMSY